MKLRLHAGYGGSSVLHKIVLDDVDVSDGFNYCCLEMRAGHLATLTLGAPIIENGWVGGDVKVQILPDTREALIALGWSPPEESTAAPKDESNDDHGTFVLAEKGIEVEVDNAD